jgi:hypothetical protein
VERLVVRPAEAAFVPVQDGQRRGVLAVAEEGPAEVVGIAVEQVSPGGRLLVFVFRVLTEAGSVGLGDQGVEKAGFDAFDAPETPVGRGELMDEELLGGGGGLVVVEVDLAEVLEVINALAVGDGIAGEEAVGGGVAAGLGLAGGGFGAGGTYPSDELQG